MCFKSLVIIPMDPYRYWVLNMLSIINRPNIFQIALLSFYVEFKSWVSLNIFQSFIYNLTLINVFSFQGKSFNMMVMQVYAPTSKAEEAEVEWFYEDLQDLLELTPSKKNVLFIIGDWNEKAGSQETSE